MIMIFEDNNIRELTDIELAKTWFEKNCKWDVARYISNVNFFNSELHLSLINNESIISRSSLAFLSNIEPSPFIIDYCDVRVSLKIEQINMIPTVCASEVVVYLDWDKLNNLESYISNIKDRKQVRLLSLAVSANLYNISHQEVKEMSKRLKSKITIEYFKSFNIIVTNGVTIHLL